MIKRLSRIATAIVVAACAGATSSGIPSPQGTYPSRDLSRRHPQTRPEASNFTATSSHADVMAFIDSLREGSKDVWVTSLGKSPKGRDIPLVIVSRPMVKTPAEARRLGRPIVYVQGNIHGGEVEGKEALLALMRDLDRDPYKNVLDSVVLLAVPIYNADGNDSLGPQERNRGAQNGPPIIGQRANGQGLDLNRDYIKAEAPETRAALAFFKEWDPDVLVDLHTTDGSYHGYALTWSPPLNPAARFSGPFTRDTVLPVLADALRSNRRILTFPYGNFEGDSTNQRWATYDHRPRYGTNYYGLRGRVAILSEAYSHDPFRTRIASTYAFVHDLLSLIAANHDDIMEVGREADRRTTAFATTANSSPPIPIRSRFTTKPATAEVLMEDLARVTDSTRTEPGVRIGMRRTGKIRAVKMPILDRFEPALVQGLPYAWIIPAAQASLVAQLRMHGVFVEQTSERVTVMTDRFAIDSVVRSQAFQGHQETRLVGRWVEAESVPLEPGTFVVRGGQPLGILALYLLEPESDDGLVTWNFADAWLQPGGSYPVLRARERFTTPLRSAPER